MADRNPGPDGNTRMSGRAEARTGRKKRRVNFMALEPRVMYDGAAAATAAEHHDADASHASVGRFPAMPVVSEAAPPTPPPPPAPTPVIDAAPAGGADKTPVLQTKLQADPGAGASPAVAHDVVFIDAAVPDIQTLINAVKPSDSIYILQGDRDGVQQIADIIAQNGFNDLSSIQIVSHGLAGEVRLGNTILTDANLADHAGALATIGQALAPGGDILLYGCDVAQGAVGTQFLSDLSAATRASIAAATHDIGLTAHGEDWSLDAATGPIEASLPFTAAINGYQGLLANPNITATQTWVLPHDVAHDADLDGNVDPGDTIVVTTVISNSGGDASGVTLDETLNHLTPGTNVDVSPLALNDSYDTVGNTELAVGVTLSGPGIAVSGSVFNNDTEFLGDSFQYLSNTNAGHGTVTFNTNGTFDYRPDANFTGTDTFTYTITDGGLDHNFATTADNLTDTATVTIHVTGQVWYVNNTATGTGTGTSSDPFQSLASAGAAAGAGDTIYVEHGDGTTTNQNAGVTLSGDGERLIGSGVALAVAGTYDGVANPTLAAAGTAPSIGNAAGNAVSATDVIPAEIAGLSISASNDAIHLAVTNADTGTTSIHDNTVTAAGGKAVSLNHSGSATWTVNTDNDNLTSTGNAFDAQKTGSGNLVLDVSNDVVTSGATGIAIGGSTGAGKVFMTGFANNSVDGNTVGTGVSIDTATFDATPGGTFQTVSGGTAVIGSSTNAVGGSGMVLTNVSGDLSFTDLDIFAGGGSALKVVGTGGINIGAGTGTRVTVSAGVATLEATGGAAADITNATVDLQLSSLESTNSATTGVNLDTVAGKFSAGTGSSISGATGTDFNINAGNATVDYQGSINDSSGKVVSVTGALGGTKSFEGSITGGSIFLNNNTGATIAFSGALALSAGTSDGFTATGGGTVTATDTTSTITTTTGTALKVQNTTIGAGGLHFKKISADGAVNGILLQNTGTTGGLTVTGGGNTTQGGDGSGGTIQNTTGAGIELNNTSNVSFNDMKILTTVGSGIDGSNGVNNFSFTHGTISNSGLNSTGTSVTGVAGTSNIAFNTGEFGASTGTEKNLTGTVTITDNVLSNAFYSGIDVHQADGTISNANISHNAITSLTGTTLSKGSGIVLSESGSASTVASITQATIDTNVITNFGSGAGISVVGGNVTSTSATAGTYGSDSTHQISITNNTIHGQDATDQIGTQGINVGVSGVGTGNFFIDTNDIKFVKGAGIAINSGGLARVNATISHNTIDAHNLFSSAGIAGGTSRQFANTDNPLANFNILSNNIKNTDGQGIKLTSTRASAHANYKIDNNTVAAPLDASHTGENGILVTSGNSASGNETVSLEISGNTTAGSADALSNLAAGIGLSKEGTSTTTNAFQIVGLTPVNTSLDTPGNTEVEDYVDSQNPGSALGSFGTRTDLVNSTTGFVGIASLPSNLILTPGGIDPGPLASDPGPQGTTTQNAGSGSAGAGTTPSDQGTSGAPADTGTSPQDTTSTTPSGQGATDTANVNNGVLTQAELDAVVAAALQRWEATGLSDAQIAYLQSVHFSIADLGGLSLGTATTGQVTIDTNAAGNGWFIDPTPLSDSEFANNVGGALYTTPDQAAAGHVDLLTTVMHEMGHELGLGDTYAASNSASLMYGYIVDGERRLPTVGEAAGAVFGNIAGADFAFGTVNIGALPAGKSVTVVFEATADAQPNNGFIANASSQGTVNYTGFPAVLTSPTVGGLAAPTVTPIESLTLGGTVWFDNGNGVGGVGNDGLQNGSEPGVQNVSVSVFADTNSDNVPDGAALATVLTDSNGNYSFAGLAPGTYIARVNSLPAGFTGASAVVDGTPDDNIDGDNNGQPLAGGVILTHDITLSYNGEPTADPAQNNQNDINTTLDIGLIQDQPPTITSNGGGATASISVPENQSAVTTVTATDPDSPTLTYSISGGVDAAKFSIDSSTGVLTFVTAPDFENPTDSGHNNVYDVVVQVSDGTLADTQAIAVTVTDVNDNAPVFASGTTATTPENVSTATAVYTAHATDADGTAANNTVTYSLSSGGDNDLFNIDSATGAVTFKTSPNFEAPADAGGNNVYDITVHATDNGSPANDTPQAVSITVTNVNEAPVVTPLSNTVSYTEKASAVTLEPTASVSDPDNPANFSGGFLDVTLSNSHAGDQIVLSPTSAFTVDGSGNVIDTATSTTIGTATGFGSTHVHVALNGAATQAEVSGLLDTLAFDSTSNDPTNAQRTATVTFDDGGNTGAGSHLSASSSVTINVLPVDDAPTFSSTPTNPTFTEKAGIGQQAAAVALFSGTAIDTIENGEGIIGLNLSVGGLQDGANETLVVDGSSIALVNGTSGATTGHGLAYAVAVSGGTATVTLTDGGSGIAQATMDTIVDGIAYQNTAVDTPTAGTRTITLNQIQDSGGTANGGHDTTLLTTSSNVNVVAVNDAPVATITPASLGTVTEQSGSLSLKGQMSVSDVDALGAVEHATLSVDQGIINVTAGTSGASVFNSGTSTVTLVGTVAQINALLNTDATSTVAYVANLDNPAATTHFTLTADDRGNTGVDPSTVGQPATGTAATEVGSDTATITVTGVNDAPVNLVPGAQSVGTNGHLLFSAATNNAITITDPDAGTADVTVTLSVGSGNGTLTLATTAGLTSSTGNGTFSVTLTGALTAINTALNGLDYHAGAAGSRTLTVTTNDNGHTPGPALQDQDTVAITVSDVTVTQVTTLTGDTDHDGVVDPGETVTTVVTINNTSGSDATNVNLNEILNGMTEVPGTREVTPIAFDDSISNLMGNTPVTISAAQLLANDIDPDSTTPLSNVGLTISGVQDVDGGHATFDSTTGTITFTPTTGFSGLAHFDYTVTDQQGLHNVTAGIVTLNFNAGNIWYVDANYNTANGASDGSFAHPFTSFTATNLNGAGGNGDVDHAGDTIFVYSTNTGGPLSYAGGLTLEASEKLIGDGVAFTANGTSIGHATDDAAHNPIITYGAGTGILLSTDNTIRGITLFGSDANGVGIADNNGTVGTLNIDHVAITGAHTLSTDASGEAIAINQGGTVNASFTSVESYNSAGDGIDLEGVGGSFSADTVEIRGSQGAGVHLVNNTATVALSGGGIGDGASIVGTDVVITGGAADVTIAADLTKSTAPTDTSHIVDVESRTGGTVTFSGQFSSNHGILVGNNTGGTITFTGDNTKQGLQIHTATQDAVTLTNNSGATINFLMANTLFGMDLFTTTGNGFVASGGGTINITGTGNTITTDWDNSTTTGGQILSLSDVTIGASGVTFASLTANKAVGSAGGDAISFHNVDGGTFNGGNVSIAGTTGAGHDGIQMDGGSSATFNFNSATISNTAAAGINLTGATGDGAVTFNTVSINGTGGAGVSIAGNKNTVTISAGTIGNTDDPAGQGVIISGGSADVTVGAAITKTTAGKIVDVSSRTAGTVSFSGNLSATGGFDNGISATSNTGGTVVLSGSTKTLSTGGFTAVFLNSNTGATINFLNGGLAITTAGAAPGLSATGGGTVAVVGSGNTISSGAGTALNVVNTTIGSTGLTFQSISANGGTNGIVLNNTGTSGGLTVTGGASTAVGGDGSGGTIQNTTGAGIELIDTKNVSLNNMKILTTQGSGIDGHGSTGVNLGVNNFSFTHGTISNSGLNSSGTGVTGTAGVSNIAFNAGEFGASTGQEKNVTGTVTITNNVLTNAFYNGVDISQLNGTISNATISGNTITSTTSQVTSKGSGISLNGFGSASTVASVTQATIDSNTISNFVSGAGIVVEGGNSTASSGVPAGTYGQDSSHQISITNNTIHGQSASVKMGTQGMFISFNGVGSGNVFVDHNNIQFVTGLGIGMAANGLTHINAELSFNTIDAHNTVASAGIGGGTARTFTSSDSAVANFNIHNNTIKNTDGNGILMNSIGASAHANYRIVDNNVAAPIDNPQSGTTYGIRVSSGNNNSLNETVSLEIHGNTTAGDNDGAGTIASGIGLRKQGTNPGVNAFQIVGYTGPGTSPSVEQYVNAQNPNSAAGSFGVGGTTLISATSGFTGITSLPSNLLVAPGNVNPVPPASTLGPIASDPAADPTGQTATDPSTSTSGTDPGTTSSTTSATGGDTGTAPATTTPVQPPSDVTNVNNGILTQPELDAIVAQALAEWSATGLTAEQIAFLKTVTFDTSDMAGLSLGESTYKHVTIDTNAAGYGWFIDPTPADNSEFANVNGSELTADAGSAAAGHIDLLTTVMHEMGHQLGLGDTYVPADRASLMYGYIVTGERRLPIAGEADGAALGAIANGEFAVGPVAIGTLPAGKAVDVIWQATIDAQPPGLIHNLSNQATVTGSFGTVVSNTVVTTLDTLSLGDRVFLDANNNNTYDSGEGVDGVKLTLFVDSNHSGGFDAGDTQVATTTTSGGGLYSFGGLAPGDYIVRVDQSNFDPGGVFDTPTGTTVPVPGSANPNDNLDGDSNGIASVGNGTVSNSIRLDYNLEPTNTFVSGNDTNNTLDFGFHFVPPNPPPVVTAGNTVPYTEQQPTPVTLDNALTLTDNDTDMAGATVSITGGFLAGDELRINGSLSGSIDNGANGTIAYSYNAASGILTLTGSDTVADYEAALRLVTFDSTSDNPTGTGLPGSHGSRTVSWVVNDGTSNSTPASTTVNITPVNDAPSGADNTITMLEDGTRAFTAADFGFTDVDGNAFAGVVITAHPASGTLLLNGSTFADGTFIPVGQLGNLTFAPAPDANGNAYASFSFEVRDDGGTAAGGVDTSQTANTITVNVTPVSDAPSGTDSSATTAEDSVYTFQTIDFSAGFSDPHDTPPDTFTGVVITSQPLAGQGVLKLNGSTFANGTFIDASQIGNLTFTPTADFNGNAAFTFEVRDTGTTLNGGQNTASANTFTVHVTPVNDAPTVINGTTASATTIAEDTPSATGDAVSSLFGSHFSDAADQVPGGSSANAFAGIAVIANGSGAAGQWQYFNGTSWTDIGAASDGAAVLLRASTDIRFNPAANFNGTAPTLGVRLVDDSQGALTDGGVVDLSTAGSTGGTTQYSAATMTLGDQVTAVNDAPVVALPPSYAAQPNVARPINNIILSDVDENDAGATPTWQVILTVGSGTLDGAGGNGIIDGVTVGGSHSTSMTLQGSLADLRTYLDTNQKLSFTGSGTNTTVTVTLNDQGNVGSGGSLADTTTASITFNAPPVIAGDLQESVLEGGTVIITGLDLSASDPDHSNPSPGDLVYTVTGTTNGQVLLNGVPTTTFLEAQLENSNVSFQHDGSETLTASFTVTVTDGGSPPATSAPATVNIAVTPVNDAPILDNVTDHVSYIENGAAKTLSSSLTVGDVDSSNLSGATVSITAGFVAGDELSLNGSLSGSIVNAGGTITYSYNAATGVLTLSGSDTLADYQAALRTVAFDSTSDNPTNFGANPQRTLSWQITDDSGSPTAAGAVVPSTILVDAVNDPPVAVDDAGAAIEAGGTFNATPGAPAQDNVILGGVGGAGADSDVDNHVSDLVVSAIRTGPESGGGTAGTLGVALQGSFGKLTLDAHGNYVYVVDDTNPTVQALNVGNTLTDTFTYTLQDPGGLTDKAQIVITIQGRNDAPVAVDDTASATEKGGTLNTSGGVDPTGNVITANDSDVDNTTASLTIGAVRTGTEAGSGTAGTVGQALQGSFGKLTLNSDGSYVYNIDQTNPTVEALNVGDTLTETFTYTVKDPGGLSDTAQLTVTIHGADDAPVARDDAGTAQVSGTFLKNEPAIGNVITKGTGADTDVDNAQSSLTVSDIRTGTKSGTGTNGTVGQILAGKYGFLLMAADGTYVYVANDFNPTVAALNQNQTLTDSFTYTVKDPKGLTDKATLNITIKGASHAPPPPHGDGDAGHPHDIGHDFGQGDAGSSRAIGYDPASFSLPNAFGTGSSVSRVYADATFTPTTDSTSFSVAVQLLPFETALGGDVVTIDATLADGRPLPDWLHFDGQKLAFAGTPPNGMVASLVPAGDQSDTNLATGSIPPNAPTDAKTDGTQNLTIELVAHDAQGNVSIMTFTLILRPGSHTSIDPALEPLQDVTDHADRALTAPDRFTWVIDRDRLTHAAGAAGARAAGIDLGAAPALPGRASLAQQLDRSGWRSMNASRAALLQSLRDGAHGWQ